MTTHKGTPVIHIGILSGTEFRFELRGNFLDQGKSQYPEGIYLAHVQDEKITIVTTGSKLFVDSGFFCNPKIGKQQVSDFLMLPLVLNFIGKRRRTRYFAGD